MKATDLPRMRALFLGMLPGDTTVPEHERGLVDRCLRHGELFYVTPEMAEVAIVAGQDFPEFRLQRSDLPSEAGVLYFDAGGRPDIRIWTVGITDAGQSCVWVGMFTYEPDFFALWPNVDPWVFGEDHHGEPLLWYTAAIWQLMQQPLAFVANAPYNRGQLKRLRKARIDPAAVRVISLRRVVNHSGKRGDPIHHDHRWVVRGHWRRQWYPRREDHVPIWIQAHVKGPDGAPLLMGEKVHAWRR